MSACKPKVTPDTFPYLRNLCRLRRAQNRQQLRQQCATPQLPSLELRSQQESEGYSDEQVASTPTSHQGLERQAQAPSSTLQPGLQFRRPPMTSEPGQSIPQVEGRMQQPASQLLQPTLAQEMQVVLLSAMLFFYPSVSQTMLQIFACVAVEDPWFWAYQMDQQCYKGQHQQLVLSVGISGLLLCVLLPPALLAWILYRNRGSALLQSRTQIKYLFIFHSYKQRYYWWEALRMLYILGLVSVRVMFVGLLDPQRLGLFFGALMGFLILTLAVRPHRFKTIFYLEMTGTGLVAVTTYLLQFALFDESGPINIDSYAFHGLVQFVLVLFVLFAIVLVLLAVYSVWMTHGPTIHAIGSSMVAKRFQKLGGAVFWVAAGFRQQPRPPAEEQQLSVWERSHN